MISNHILHKLNIFFFRCGCSTLTRINLLPFYFSFNFSKAPHNRNISPVIFIVRLQPGKNASQFQADHLACLFDVACQHWYPATLLLTAGSLWQHHQSCRNFCHVLRIICSMFTFFTSNFPVGLICKFALNGICFSFSHYSPP